jgi:uncharacterized protein
MFKRNFSLAIAVAATSLASTKLLAELPAFNCKAKDLSSAEKLICEDAELSKMDRELSAVFAQAKAIDEKVVKGTLPAEQRGWIKGRNDCWKESDLRACLVKTYLRRTAELQAKYKLLSPVATTSYTCENNPAHELIVSYFATTQRAAVAEHGDDVFYLFEDAKDHYQGGNEILTVRGDGVEFVPAYEAQPLTCVPRLLKKGTIDPSWDKNGDGLNDCEVEGICDHTVDYSKPRTT